MKLRFRGPADCGVHSAVACSQPPPRLLQDSNDNITRRRDFENFVRTAGHRAAGLSKADDPAAAAVQLALCQPDGSEVCRAAESICQRSGDKLFFRWR